MKVKRDIKDWRKILTDVIYGIYYLTTQLGKVHTDLHFGNILIVKEQNGKDRALIHDFGRSFDVHEYSYKSTLLSFCNEFLLCKNRDDLNIPREIVGSIQDLENFVKKQDMSIQNIQNIQNIENMYESFIIPILYGSEDF